MLDPGLVLGVRGRGKGRTGKALGDDTGMKSTVLASSVYLVQRAAVPLLLGTSVLKASTEYRQFCTEYCRAHGQHGGLYIHTPVRDTPFQLLGYPVTCQ